MQQTANYLTASPHHGKGEDFVKRKISFTRPMALLLSFSMMAGVCPAPVLAAELERPAAVQAATQEQAAPAEDGDTQTPSAPEQPE